MRVHLSALLFVTACTTGDAVSTRGQAIIGGQTANPADYPTVVALEDTPGNWFCTGTLIAPQWVLTAAHCVADGPTTGLHVRFDDPDVNSAAGGKVVAVAEVHAHTGFDWELWDNDVALLELMEPVTDRTPTAIHRDPVTPGTAVLDVGYGVADNNDGGGGLLRKVDKVTADCAGANDPGVSGANLLCMDASDGRGSCFGDSGGPTFATINGNKVVVGITSGGTGELCGAGWDLYTSVHAELDFIDTTMNAAPPPPPDPDPNPNPDPPPPDPNGGGNKDDDGGGCSTGRGNGLVLGLGLAMFFVRRRTRTTEKMVRPISALEVQ
jgi:secreted trypsin-like serine protease